MEIKRKRNNKRYRSAQSKSEHSLEMAIPFKGNAFLLIATWLNFNIGSLIFIQSFVHLNTFYIFFSTIFKYVCCHFKLLNKYLVCIMMCFRKPMKCECWCVARGLTMVTKQEDTKFGKKRDREMSKKELELLFVVVDADNDM